MINNRQNNRRRGRGGGGPRPNGGGGNGIDRGNRIDNRARGNANQLFEKYKTLARDAQMQGDRVMNEYYLQFADHYFRILNENRPRFDEQRRGREDRFERDDQDSFDDGDGYEEGAHTSSNTEDRRPVFPNEPYQNGSYRRASEAVEAEQSAEPAPVQAQPEQASVETRPASSGRGRGRRQERSESPVNDVAERIEIDRLPPAFAASSEAVAEADEAPAKPKRRGRPPKSTAIADA